MLRRGILILAALFAMGTSCGDSDTTPDLQPVPTAPERSAPGASPPPAVPEPGAMLCFVAGALVIGTWLTRRR